VASHAAALRREGPTSSITSWNTLLARSQVPPTRPRVSLFLRWMLESFHWEPGHDRGAQVEQERFSGLVFVAVAVQIGHPAKSNCVRGVSGDAVSSAPGCTCSSLAESGVTALHRPLADTARPPTLRTASARAAILARVARIGSGAGGGGCAAARDCQACKSENGGEQHTSSHIDCIGRETTLFRSKETNLPIRHWRSRSERLTSHLSLLTSHFRLPASSATC
jgi:hypothetical protein